jgi:hypothetical protein
MSYGYRRLDDDETGKCYPKRDIKTCPDGYILYERESCSGHEDEDVECYVAGLILNRNCISDPNTDNPPVSVLDCLEPGYVILDNECVPDPNLDLNPDPNPNQNIVDIPNIPLD